MAVGSREEPRWVGTLSLLACSADLWKKASQGLIYAGVSAISVVPST